MVLRRRKNIFTSTSTKLYVDVKTLLRRHKEEYADGQNVFHRRKKVFKSNSKTNQLNFNFGWKTNFVCWEN